MSCWSCIGLGSLHRLLHYTNRFKMNAMLLLNKRHLEVKVHEWIHLYQNMTGSLVSAFVHFVKRDK